MVSNPGIDGVFKFIKLDVKFSLNYIVIIDKEHCNSLDYEKCINQGACKYGISISSLEKLTTDYDVYKVSCEIAQKRFYIYFVFMGFYCCIEDFILKICKNSIEKYEGIGCCEKYKTLYKRLSKDDREKCINKAEDELFEKIIKRILENFQH
ncbi:hypothetical protein [Acidianus sp. HS-5]|uniref:hypothetical protein n=1 Tax=Acidianus sp. HS-5 TaxID=2886040 RepID=UPI001F23B6A5|nr:hypothetical protein [Acidianus sp. HS-5]BDC17463.1 hypothetical protein HS5_03530 [Acidianus sp. HS-5]